MDAIDLRHHLNTLSLSRSPSPLKDIINYMTIDGMLSLAGGLPHPSLFPFVNLEADVYAPTVDLNSDTRELVHLTVHRDDKNQGQVVDLAGILQYTQVMGNSWLLQFTHEFMRTVFQPGYGNYETLLNEGNTDGWNKVVSLLCESGDCIIIEKYTYSSAQALWIPMGCKGVPIDMDEEGMRADALEDVLQQWDVKRPGEKRPHVLYTVPTGQNPTGCAMSARRKQDIYSICVKYDIIIVEDDPYYFLQFEEYRRGRNRSATPPKYDEPTFLRSLERTFLSFDTQGRVIRLDTFSKTLAPGNRLGWFTCNPLFAERLLRGAEVTTQAPSGWSQAIIAELLRSWGPGISGYLRWLSSLIKQYEVRRDWMCDAIADAFDVEKGTDGEGLVAYSQGIKLFSFVPARAGMFLWCKMYLGEHRDYLEAKQNIREGEDSEAIFETRIWKELLEEKVLLTPGSYYTPWQGKDRKSIATSGREPDVVFFRLAFSMTTKEDVVPAIQRMAKALRLSWGIA
ncbi:PLP-dependent transferase [Desarmillaria tabescens]|uniref:PLP-dependent transferase n=1 Tax=Armillaria tabescens TaxID=1929756 RepID=A0AA39KCX6_ARMTA|nr:PLP-dependent transferase [Desarmillaria tabescens]KAK0457665.1 PLP-dependent transferase [Desarmillaria tabescens]